MTFGKKQFVKITTEAALARGAAESPGSGPDFTAQVMRRVREIGPLRSRQAFLESFQRCAWRLAPVAMTLIVVLTLTLSRMEVVSDYELAKAVLEDPADISLLALTNPE